MSVVGIDLGTTNSCVAIVNDKGVVEIINNDIGEQTTPSVVSFKENGIVVGNDARKQLEMNPKNTIFAIKRLIGYNYGDNQIKKEIETYPYQITGKTVRNKDNDKVKAVVKVDFKGERREYSPEEISGYILEKLKNIDNHNLNGPIEKAVITVPAYFSSSQRKSTKNAGKIAGLDVIGIISEPTAAAIAYSYKNINPEEEKVIFVFDFGGGTLDCTLMKIKDKKYTVIATSGDTHLGGEDIDLLLLKYAADKFKDDTGIDIMEDNYESERTKLKLECEKVKMRLSSEYAAEENIHIDDFVEGNDLDVSIEKSDFEELLDDNITEKIQEQLDDIFDHVQQKPDEYVQEVIMVGGSSRIPRIKELLKDFFDKEPVFGINPDTAVAQGAAIYAASLVGSKGSSFPLISEFNITDVIPLSIGLEFLDESFGVLLRNNTPVPAEAKFDNLTTVCDNQDAIALNIYEGQREYVKENRLLGGFIITGLTKKPAGQVNVTLKLKMTKENILEAEAYENGGKANCQLKIDYNCGEIDKDEIEEIMRRAEEFREADLEIVRTNNAFNQLDHLIYEARKSSNYSVQSIVRRMEDWKSGNKSAHSKEVNNKNEEFKRELSRYISI